MAVRRVSPTLVRGDGVGYYAYLRSLVFDGDLDFTNEYAHFASLLPEKEQPLTTRFLRKRTPRGYVPSNWPVGPAILWLPFFAAGHAVAVLSSRLGVPVALDGYSAPYQFSVVAGTCVYSFLGLLLVYRMCRELHDVRVSLLAVLGIWFATSLPAYMYFMASMSHGCSFFTVSLFLFTWQRGRGSLSPARGGLLGLLTGLMARQRYQNVIFTFPLLLELWARLRSTRRDELLSEALAAVRFALIAGGVGTAVFGLQMVTWKVLYGHLLVHVVNENLDRVVHWFRPQIARALFSSDRGLIAWTPIVGLGIVGLYFQGKKDRLLGVALLSVFLGQLYVAGCVPCDAAFGARYFISCGPVFALGLAALFEWLLRRRIPIGVITACCLLLAMWNYLLLYQYGLQMIPRCGPVSWAKVAHNSFVVIPRSAFFKATDRVGPSARTAVPGSSRVDQADSSEAPSP